MCVVAPMLVVWCVGAGVAISQLSARRRTARLVLAGLAIVATNAVVIGPLVMFVPTMLVDRGTSASSVGAVMTMLGLVRSLTVAAAWALVLAAVFVGEPPVDPQP